MPPNSIGLESFARASRAAARRGCQIFFVLINEYDGGRDIRRDD
jgi:hypothetical protein